MTSSYILAPCLTNVNRSFRLIHSLPRIGSTILSSRLLSENVKIKIYKTTAFSLVLDGCETWSLTLTD
jgi:hypothetical protein